MIARIHPALIVAMLGFYVAAPGGGFADDLAPPRLSSSERAAIVDSAIKALRAQGKVHFATGAAVEIQPEHLGEVIVELKPLRVLNDRLNVFIVLKETDEVEEGLYITNPISSFAPGIGKRFLVLERMSEVRDRSFGELYYCVIKKE